MNESCKSSHFKPGAAMRAWAEGWSRFSIYQFQLNLIRLIGWLAVAVCALGSTACSIITDLAPSKNTTADVRDWLAVPVFYATNRAKATGSELFSYSEQLNAHGRSYGIKNVLVPLPEKGSLSPEIMEKMGWQMIHLEDPVHPGKKPAVPTQCKLSNREMSAHEVIAEFDRYRSDSGSNQVVLFVHGCCATFDTSLERAAKIAAHMQLPLVIYDWVSPIGFTHYLQNETLAEQELDDFYDFLSSVEPIVPVSQTILIGHSMGARFLDSALVRRSERQCGKNTVLRYQEVIFANPDIDARSYINHNENVASNADQVRIYLATNDGRLRNSAIAHGGYARLGLPGDLLPELCRVGRQDVIDVTELGLGHEVPFWVVADLHRSGKPSREQGFELVQAGPHLFVLHKQPAASLEQGRLSPQLERALSRRPQQ